MNHRLISRLDLIKKTKNLERIMLVGGLGQVGSDLTPALSYVYGENNLLFTDLKDMPNKSLKSSYQKLDALDKNSYLKIAKEFKPSAILHLSALLSGLIKRNI